jgi:Zn-dependent peptidase ImmA (M78 family)
MIDDELLERAAEELIVAAGLDPKLRHCPVTLALRVGIRVRSAQQLSLPGDAFAAIEPNQAAIYLRTTVSKRRRDFAVAHELAEIVLGRAGYGEHDREDQANRLGAAILVPRQAVISALRGQPWRSIREFARCLDVSPACAALRLGETTGDPIALVEPTRVRLRGAPWPFEETPERLARCRALPSGAYRLRLTRERVVVGAA